MPGSQHVPTDAPKGDKPIQLYSLATPNGVKVAIALEELGLPYDAHTINIGKDEQFQPWFLAISPNNRIPAIVDHDGPGGQPIALFESGAILQYLAEKTGKLLSKEPVKRWQTIQWLNWQMGGVGPMFGQMGHFHKYAVNNGHDIEYAKKRYLDEAKRLTGVLEKQLEGQDYVVGEYSIADISLYGWISQPAKYQEYLGKEFESFKNVNAWIKRVGERSAVQKGMKVNPFG